ncbi:hypothetical protein PILCRDRAFT_822120 [Piloderma croceum F 1598]|uniref:RCC1/BLIP-II protein n=1 Tax=Piloderma croceum (strain F 1598) TaxID=765440 RepID=A0A0C3FNP8_PILCF|nr:hypothetical protein PILCRDRAFT_822120 [Piloderma croceum F 1598]
MFRQFSSNAFRFRRFSSLKHSPYGSQTYGSRIRLGSPHFIASSTAVAATLLWYSTTTVIHCDALASDRATKSRDESTVELGGSDGTLNSVVWGSNKSNAIAPQNPEVESVRTPLVAVWLRNVALRDLALHENHAACVDARGDIYQWGNGFFGPPSVSADGSRNRKPTRTLRDKNIIRLALTESRVFALSASGHIYVLAADSAKQSAKISTSPWYRPGWLLGKKKTVDFIEILPKHRLSWREKFVAISAGTDHLLALTSSGRAFAHPISTKANSHGQLGFRKFDIPSGAISSPSRLAVELTPNIITDPYAKASAFSRPETPSSDTLKLFDNENIRFSDTLFEIPGLRGIKVAQAVAAGRTSFVRTDSGKVLGWGANENAQIGLGSNVTLDAITVPTEVVLWRTVSNKTQSRCLNICSGGDLTCFTVERIDGNDVRTVDLLMCGNGRWGGLGNNIYSNAQGNPLRAKSVSGLLEYSEKEQALQPIIPHAISISPTGHVLLTLETHERSGPGGGGRDLYVWGANQQYELGTGKRTSLAAPTTLQQGNEARFMLTKAQANVNDMQGKVWKRGVKVEQCAQAGYGNTIVYWKIC